MRPVTGPIVLKMPESVVNRKEAPTVEASTLTPPAKVKQAEKMMKPDALLAVYDPFYPNSYKIDFNYASAYVIFDGDPTIEPNETKKVKVHFVNHVPEYGNIQYFLKLWFLDDGKFSVRGPKTVLLSRNSPFDTEFFHDQPYADAEFEITAGDTVEPTNRVVLEVTADNRVTAAYIPVILLGK